MQSLMIFMHTYIFIYSPPTFDFLDTLLCIHINKKIAVRDFVCGSGSFHFLLLIPLLNALAVIIKLQISSALLMFCLVLHKQSLQILKLEKKFCFHLLHIQNTFNIKFEKKKVYLANICTHFMYALPFLLFFPLLYHLIWERGLLMRNFINFIF